MKNILTIDDHPKHLADLLKELADQAVTFIGGGCQLIPTMDPESDIEFIRASQLMIFPYFLYG